MKSHLVRICVPGNSGVYVCMFPSVQSHISAPLFMWDEHEPITLSLCGCDENSLIAWEAMWYLAHTHRHTQFWGSRRTPLPPFFIWTPVAKINCRYDCYQSPQGCSPLSGATSGLMINMSLWYPSTSKFSSGWLPLSAHPLQNGVFPECISELRLTGAVCDSINCVQRIFCDLGLKMSDAADI